MSLTDQAKESAFVTPDNFLQYKVMPFGVRNAPDTFQRLVNSVLYGMHGCEAYLDDVVLYSNIWTDHFAAANLTINLAKCEFGKARVTYLGKVVGGGQVRPVEVKIELSVDSLCLKTDVNFTDFWVWQGTIEVLDNTLLLLWCH